MNANELADELEAFYGELDGYSYMIGEAISMLRKQQGEIDTYKSQNGSQIDTYRYKELTDGEMDEICRFLNQSRISWSGNEFVKEAMRMALRKAQEK